MTFVVGTVAPVAEARPSALEAMASAPEAPSSVLEAMSSALDGASSVPEAMAFVVDDRTFVVEAMTFVPEARASMTDDGPWAWPGVLETGKGCAFVAFDWRAVGLFWADCGDCAGFSVFPGAVVK